MTANDVSGRNRINNFKYFNVKLKQPARYSNGDVQVYMMVMSVG